jgi:hypothetical protein
MNTNIALGKSSEDCVDERVEHNVGIGVTG